MPEFRRSRLERKTDEEITRKTVVVGVVTLLVLAGILVFGLPLLVKFSVLLGEARSRREKPVEEKKLPPLPPRLVVPFEATNSAEVKIWGTAERGVEVELLKNDVSLGKMTVDENGEFVFDGIELDKGENSFSGIAMTGENGSSEPSKPTIIVYDDVLPELTVVNPGEETSTVDYADFDIIGKTEKGVSVMVGGRIAVVNDNGDFKLKTQLASGKNEIEIIARDSAGNESKKKITITYDF